jgi:hypothetical protein
MLNAIGIMAMLWVGIASLVVLSLILGILVRDFLTFWYAFVDWLSLWRSRRNRERLRKTRLHFTRNGQ